MCLEQKQNNMFLLPGGKIKHTSVYIVFESCVLEIEDEMSTELLLCAGVEIEDIFYGAFNPVDFH